MKTIAIVGPLDTKGIENKYLKKCIEANGCNAIVIDIRTIGKAEFEADVSNEEVAALAGTSIEALQKANNRLKCINAMGKGAAEAVFKLYSEGLIHGVISMGGSQTTSMAAAVMRKMPVGFPKVLVSTIATSANDQNMLTGINDTFVINPLVDVAGMNPVIKLIIERAAGAITGMAKAMKEDEQPVLDLDGGKPCVGISMWGVTTKCVMRVAALLEAAGYQPLIFHATGIGGHTMERLIEQGVIVGVADITLAEFANPIAGGDYDEDPIRLTTAGAKGIPQVIVPGTCDMVKHVTHDGMVAPKFDGVKYYLHNPSLLFTRSSVEDNRNIGAALADRINKAKGPVRVLFPLKGISAYDIAGGPLYDKACDDALKAAIRSNLRADIDFTECNCHINDVDFAEIVAQSLLAELRK